MLGTWTVEPLKTANKKETGGIAESNMTLRDYFAAKAMQGYLVSLPLEFVAEQPKERALAVLAYEMADAMLGARK